MDFMIVVRASFSEFSVGMFVPIFFFFVSVYMFAKYPAKLCGGSVYFTIYVNICCWLYSKENDGHSVVC